MIMEQNDVIKKYEKCYDKRKRMFGIKVVGQRKWYVEPCFEELGIKYYETEDNPEIWFKQNGRYGLYNFVERRIIMPAIYGCPFDFGKNSDVATVWKDYKAGVIDRNGNEVIPIIYDELYCRSERVPLPESERHCVTDEDGEKHFVGPKYKDIFRGYACFTNEGGVQAYDENCKPSEFYDWEKPRLNHVVKYANKEAETMTVEELEALIRQEYIRLVEMGYGSRNFRLFSEEHDKQIYEQEEHVRSLISDRSIKMNKGWVHNPENANRIGRTNRLLMRAVEKAVKLGDRTSKSLEWMEKVGNQEDYYVDVVIYPKWGNSQSDLRYEPKYESAKEESSRLYDEWSELSETHIWNIIAVMGHGEKCDGISLCFSRSSTQYCCAHWDVRNMTLDDGCPWDEGIHFPAYQDEYFTLPFYELYLAHYNYSFEDLCSINDFRINVDVHLETREQDKIK